VRIAVFYNNDAGSSASADDIRAAVAGHGHQLVHLVEKSEGLERIFDCPVDLIVAAGGDGTVASVARAAAGRDTPPMAVLPLGTANNIATSLGCDGPVDVLVGHWARATPVKTDLGVASGRWGDRRFVEGVGGGLVVRSIEAVHARQLPDDIEPDVRIHLALDSYLDVSSTLEARPWRMRLDDEVLEGEYLLVEVLNIRSVGPNFAIANGAELGDGLFTVVVAGEADRDQLIDYWRARLRGETPPLSLQTRHATQVVIEQGDDLHIDDTLLRVGEGEEVRLWVERGALSVVCGPFPRCRESEGFVWGLAERCSSAVQGPVKKTRA
jgi:diacylglycerol kinase family enzyme